MEVHRQALAHQVVVLHQVEARLLMGIMPMSSYSSKAKSKYKQLQSFQNLQAEKIGLFVKTKWIDNTKTFSQQQVKNSKI